MRQHYNLLQNLSTSQGDSVVVWTTTPSVLQTALDEEQRLKEEQERLKKE